jgi:DNA-binding NarL/FixJ family response regulator
MKPIDIIIVDDHKIFRDGLILNLKDFPDEINVLADVESSTSLLEILKSNIPDVLLLDYQLVETTGVQIARIILENPIWSSIKVIILSAHKSGNIYSNCFEFVINAIDAGVHGYLLKDASIKEIMHAIKEVHSGNGFILSETFNYKEVTKTLVKDRNRLLTLLGKPRNFGLSNREIEVINYLSKGYSAKEIGSKLFITEDSITTHKDHIKQKLFENYHIKLRNTVELVVWSIKNKVIQILEETTD